MADVAPRSERLCAAVVPAGRSTTRSWRTDTRLVTRPRCRPSVDRSYPPTSPGDYCLDRCRCSLEKTRSRPLEMSCSRDGLIRMSARDLKRIALLSEVLVGRQAGDYLHKPASYAKMPLRTRTHSRQASRFLIIQTQSLLHRLRGHLRSLNLSRHGHHRFTLYRNRFCPIGAVYFAVFARLR